MAFTRIIPTLLFCSLLSFVSRAAAVTSLEKLQLAIAAHAAKIPGGISDLLNDSNGISEPAALFDLLVERKPPIETVVSIHRAWNGFEFDQATVRSLCRLVGSSADYLQMAEMLAPDNYGGTTGDSFHRRTIRGAKFFNESFDQMLKEGKVFLANGDAAPLSFLTELWKYNWDYPQNEIVPQLEAWLRKLIPLVSSPEQYALLMRPLGTAGSDYLYRNYQTAYSRMMVRLRLDTEAQYSGKNTRLTQALKDLELERSRPNPSLFNSDHARNIMDTEKAAFLLAVAKNPNSKSVADLLRLLSELDEVRARWGDDIVGMAEFITKTRDWLLTQAVDDDALVSLVNFASGSLEKGISNYARDLFKAVLADSYDRVSSLGVRKLIAADRHIATELGYGGASEYSAQQRGEEALARHFPKKPFAGILSYLCGLAVSSRRP
jgi:hypothetical protein